MKAIDQTNFKFPGQSHFYRGKVREVYSIDPDLLVMIASDRISAFDVILPKPIPGKGAVLNLLANYFLDATASIVPNWKLSCPHPMVTIGKRAEPFKVEMVIRGYLTGHAWRTYRSGARVLCGVSLPEGMKENQAFPEPIITPTTKADQGLHDEDISREAILSQGIVSESDYLQLEEYTRALFAKGQAMAREKGLILVDTKYEFGKTAQGEIILIDEIHTPDSSRYFYAAGYAERLANDEPQKQLSKEFVREWLIAHNFQGKEGQTVPEMTEEFIAQVSDRYAELYRKITDQDLNLEASLHAPENIEKAVTSELKKWR